MDTSFTSRTVEGFGRPIEAQSSSGTSNGSRGSCVVIRASRRSLESMARTTPGRRFRPCISVKGNSTDTTSPTLNAVIGRVVRRVVPEKLFDGQSLPVEFFWLAANQVRQIPIQPKLVSERQSLDCFFNFLNGSHGLPKLCVKRALIIIVFLSFRRATILRCPGGREPCQHCPLAASAIYSRHEDDRPGDHLHAISRNCVAFCVALGHAPLISRTKPR